VNPISKQELPWVFFGYINGIESFLKTKHLQACSLELIWTFFVFRIYSALARILINRKLEFNVIENRST